MWAKFCTEVWSLLKNGVKELKIQLYREKKRQLEVKLRQHLQREGLQGNGSLPKEYGKQLAQLAHSKQLAQRRHINGFATLPNNQVLQKSKESYQVFSTQFFKFERNFLANL